MHAPHLHTFPGSSKIKALKKEAKHYHFDWTQVESPGARFENLVACHLLKWCHFIEDTEAHDMEVRYFRDQSQIEVDFVILKNRKPIKFIEVKTSDVDTIQVILHFEKDF